MNLKTIDAHVGGQTLRLIVDGCPGPRGKTMLEKSEWVERHADSIRRTLMLEPRGHADMCGALLTEPVSPGSHAGILFMHNAGFSPMSGHGLIAAVTIALERRLLIPGGDGRTVVVDTPAGTVRARATYRAGEAGEAGGVRRVGRAAGEPEDAATAKVESVAFLNVPSFVLHPGLALKVGARHLRVDVAFGGAFYAIADSEAAGLGVVGARAAELRRVGMEITRGVEAALTLVHPSEPRITGLEGTILTAPPLSEQADLRSTTVFANGALDRSPGGTETAALMAVLSAMGLLTTGTRFVHESITGAHFTGHVTEPTVVGDYEAIIPEIAGSAWITGEHTFFVDDNDPLADGFLI